jgi:type VI secretion system ImpA family protein
MSEPTTDTLDDLLKPIPGASPAGAWVRDEPIYRQLLLARQSENASLPQGVWKRDVKRADWREVTALAREILSSRSKDLQVAVWLVDSEVHRRGFAGLAPTLSALTALCRTFWAELFPKIDPSDPDARNAPLEWLNEKLPILLHQLPITGTDEVSALTWTDYLNALRHERVRQSDPKSAARAEQGGRVTLEAFSESAALTSKDQMRANYEALALAGAALTTLEDELDRLAGKQRPSLHGLADSVEEMANWAKAYLPEPEPELEPEETHVAEAVGAPLATAANEMPAAETPALVKMEARMSGPITSREEAYRRLSEAAEYLFQTERHSPVPYIVRQAVVWGQMPLHELLAEIQRNGSDLSHFLEIMGLRKAP